MTSRVGDIGLGTTYERFALNAWLAHLLDNYPFLSVLEGPGDGMTGIPGLNSLIFGRRGLDVAIVLADEEAVHLARRGWRSQECLKYARFLRAADGRIPVTAEQFDLVWNFNRLPFSAPQELIAEMVRTSRRYVLLCAPNRYSYGFLARRLHHRLTGKPWSYGNIDVMNVKTVVNLLSEFDMQILETTWLDAPWWPDIIDISEFVTDLAPFLSGVLKKRGASTYFWNPEHLPYFDAVAYPEVHERIHNLFFIERSGADWLKPVFAHHFGVFAVKRGKSDV